MFGFKVTDRKLLSLIPPPLHANILECPVRFLRCTEPTAVDDGRSHCSIAITRHFSSLLFRSSPEVFLFSSFFAAPTAEILRHPFFTVKSYINTRSINLPTALWETELLRIQFRSACSAVSCVRACANPSPIFPRRLSALHGYLVRKAMRHGSDPRALFAVRQELASAIARIFTTQFMARPSHFPTLFERYFAAMRQEKIQLR